MYTEAPMFEMHVLNYVSSNKFMPAVAIVFAIKLLLNSTREEHVIVSES